MNKVVSLTLLFVSWLTISYLTWSAPLLTQLAGYVLNFACGMLAGHIAARR